LTSSRSPTAEPLWLAVAAEQATDRRYFSFETIRELTHPEIPGKMPIH
jgi:hypothetical protein